MTERTPQLVAAKYKGNHRIWLRFADGTAGAVDLEDELWGEMFEPLRDTARFLEFRLDREFNTLVWPDGADLAPEFVYDKAATSAKSP